jgi:phenylacetate-CoA ligase
MEPVHRALWKARLALNGNSLSHLTTIERLANADAGTVSSYKRERLERLLRHAHDRVPYYRSLLARHGVVEGRNVHVERLTELPLLDKGTLRHNWQSLRSEDAEGSRTRLNQSGGSTGEPVRLLQDADYKDWNTATKLFYEGRAGHRLGEPLLRLWGSERDIMGARRSGWARFGQWVRNETMLNSFLMPVETMFEYVERINAFRPSTIVAYSESIFRLARFIDERGLAVHSPGAIFTSATTLYAPMRETIERVFGAPVFDRYGSREVGVVACEMPGAEGLVCAAPTHWVEILRPDGSAAAAGETGEIVVTPLTNLAMPLIRYRIGDLGSWRRDDDGAGTGPRWPRLDEIAGRVTDTFFTRDGTQVFGEYFTHLFYERQWVRMFQVVQEEFDLVRIRIVPGESAPTGPALRQETAELGEQVRLVMGNDCRVEVELTDAIETPASGKHRYTLSHVDPASSAGAAAGAAPD